MQAEYRIPKRTVRVDVQTAGLGETLTLFLAERAERHAGPERPFDLLNGSHDFFPAQHDDGRILFLCRENIWLMRVPRDPEDAPDSDADVVREVVLTLEDGQTIEGAARYQLPDASRRLQDFLNQAGAFLSIRQADGSVLVNKRRVAHVSER